MAVTAISKIDSGGHEGKARDDHSTMYVVCMSICIEARQISVTAKEVIFDGTAARKVHVESLSSILPFSFSSFPNETVFVCLLPK